MENQELTACPNPLRTCKIGPLMLAMQMADEFWATRDKHGNLTRELFGLSLVKDGEGELQSLRLIAHKLKLEVVFRRRWDPSSLESQMKHSTSPMRSRLIGSTMFAVQYSSEFWAVREGEGSLVRKLFGLSLVRAKDGPEHVFSLVLHRLLFMAAR